MRVAPGRWVGRAAMSVAWHVLVDLGVGVEYGPLRQAPPRKVFAAVDGSEGLHLRRREMVGALERGGRAQAGVEGGLVENLLDPLPGRRRPGLGQRLDEQQHALEGALHLRV